MDFMCSSQVCQPFWVCCSYMDGHMAHLVDESTSHMLDLPWASAPAYARSRHMAARDNCRPGDFILV